MNTTFLRLLDVATEGKAVALRAALDPSEAPSGRVFERDVATFAEVPGSPFAYWVSDQTRRIFVEHERFDRRYFCVRGAYTTDDFRFYRLAWEISLAPGRQAAVPLAKGGVFSPFYCDVHLAIRWGNDGAELKPFLAAYRERKGWGSDWSACLNGHGHYLRAGLTWPRRTTSGLSVRVMPAGCIFTDKGPAAFVDQDAPDDLLALCALTSSSMFASLMAVQLAAADAAARSYEVGLMQQTPVPGMNDEQKKALALLARRSWALRRSLDTTNETSRAFLLPDGVGISALRASPAAVERDLADIQSRVDQHVQALYGSSPDMAPGNEPPGAGDAGLALEGEDEEEANAAQSEALLSWCVGVAFGRFDPRLATGERAIPPEPEPFDPLPARSPGMWPADEPQDPPPPPILLDDPGHKLDLATHVTAVATRVSCTVPETLRQWLAHDFFPLHIKMYSKSRRKAPIYWQLATPSASYSVWLYIHAFTKDTLYQAQKHVDDKLDHEQRQLERMRAEYGPSPNAGERARLDAQAAFVDELRAMGDEVQRVAPLWSPNLDDGVIINFSLLHRLVPQNKPWQQELRATWAALASGEYDWAHLAMHLWAERVVPQCATDRSLAIAHDLEDVFWLEGDDKKWRARPAPTRPIEELVRERTSAAVKAALKSLEEAPMAGGGPKKPKSGKKRK